MASARPKLRGQMDSFAMTIATVLTKRRDYANDLEHIVFGNSKQRFIELHLNTPISLCSANLNPS